MTAQPDFGVSPNLTVELLLVPNERSWKPDNRSRLIIDLIPFPQDQKGVYVVRFKERVFCRLIGESSVLKVGESGRSFWDRFRDYNQKNEAATTDRGLSEFLMGCSAGFTDFLMMWMLPRLLKLGPIVVDLYYCENTKERQTEFLYKCLDAYWDMPPLNRGLA